MELYNNILSSNIDIVFCIDGTASMAPCIDKIKNSSNSFYDKLVSAISELGSEIDSVRVKAIVFRDYYSDGGQAMVESPFFKLPDETAAYQKYLSDITATGGGDYPENGLEALYYAMKSDFTATGRKDKQVIVLFTDADALDLKARADSPDYPADMVDEDGLVELWTHQDATVRLRERLKWLIMFAPDYTKYGELKDKLNKCMFIPVNNNLGVIDFDLDDLAKIIIDWAFRAH